MKKSILKMLRFFFLLLIVYLTKILFSWPFMLAAQLNLWIIQVWQLWFYTCILLPMIIYPNIDNFIVPVLLFTLCFTNWFLYLYIHIYLWTIYWHIYLYIYTYLTMFLSNWTVSASCSKRPLCTKDIIYLTYLTKTSIYNISPLRSTHLYEVNYLSCRIKTHFLIFYCCIF